MSEPDNPTKHHRRSARAVLGTLATGAMLGTAAAAAGGVPAQAVEVPTSLRQQFDQAFTPGAVDLNGPDDSGSIVVYAS